MRTRPGLEKISALRRFEKEGTLRRVPILTGNGGLFLDLEMERGVDGAMTSKEAALFSSDPARANELRERIVRESPGEPILDVLRTVMINGAATVVEDLRELGGDPADWLRRMRVIKADPNLRAAHAAQMANLERTITEALAQRLGTDPDRDPYPGLLCAVATGLFRDSVASWAGCGGTVPLERFVDLSFRALAAGLPEDCELRQVTGNLTDRKDDH